MHKWFNDVRKQRGQNQDEDDGGELVERPQREGNTGGDEKPLQEHVRYRRTLGHPGSLASGRRTRERRRRIQIRRRFDVSASVGSRPDIPADFRWRLLSSSRISP